jgi:hypothetical protein
VTLITVSYIDKLQKENSEDLAFYPLTDIQPGLFELGTVVPSTKPKNSTGYARRVAGLSLPSRFSRSHYGVVDPKEAA